MMKNQRSADALAIRLRVSRSHSLQVPVRTSTRWNCSWNWSQPKNRASSPNSPSSMPRRARRVRHGRHHNRAASTAVPAMTTACNARTNPEPGGSSSDTTRSRTNRASSGNRAMADTILSRLRSRPVISSLKRVRPADRWMRQRRAGRAADDAGETGPVGDRSLRAASGAMTADLPDASRDGRCTYPFTIRGIPPGRQPSRRPRPIPLFCWSL